MTDASPPSYAGVGSRKTPAELVPVIDHVAGVLVRRGYVLHSGGADGFDSMIERSHRGAGGLEPSIFLPWPAFNGHRSRLFTPPLHAFEIAATIHPAWDRLTSGARKLHARNVQQVLGVDLQTPVAFVVCWTPGGRAEGGTATAIKLAERHRILIHNLAHESVRAYWLRQK